MNFNLIASLFAICASITAAVTVGKDQLAKAPPARAGKQSHHDKHDKHGKHGKHSSDSSSSSSSKSSVSKSSHSKSSHSKSIHSKSDHSKSDLSKSGHSKSGHSKSDLSKSGHSKSGHSFIDSSSYSSITPSSLQIASSVNKASKICTRELEAIIYNPPNNVQAYLAKIAGEMRRDIQLIMNAFSQGNLDYIRIYVERYNVLITVAGPFGEPVLVAPSFSAYTQPFQTVAFAQTFTGRDGFFADSRNQYYNYQFSLMSTNGQYISFIISLPLSAMTLTPGECI